MGNQENTNWTPDTPDEPRPIKELLDEVEPTLHEGLPAEAVERRNAARRYAHEETFRNLSELRDQILAELEGREPDAGTQAKLDSLQEAILHAMDDVFGTNENPR